MMMIRNERGAYKKVATENVVCSTTCIMHNEYYTKKMTKNYRTL